MSNTQENLISRRYAKAFYELAVEKKITDSVLKDLMALDQIPEELGLAKQLGNPLIDRKTQIGILAALSKKMKLHAMTFNFLGVLSENRRLKLFHHVIRASVDYFTAQRGDIQASVTTARPFTAAQLKTLKATLKKATGHDVDLRAIEDAGIIGGMQVKVGSLMIDQSVKTRLDRIERILKAGVAA